MAPHGKISSDQELEHAGKEGLKGAIHGAAVWGMGSLVLGIAAYYISPVYRGLTFQFKVYLQMSGMTIGSIIEADRRMRDYEKYARRMRKLKRDEQAWKAYEDDFMSKADRKSERTGKQKEPKN